MSYTIGIKRRFWFGFRRVKVTGHDWQNGRFILNLTDDSQEHIPGFSAPVVKVYADFWTHLAKNRPAPIVRQGASLHPVQEAETEAEEAVIPPDPLTDEVRRRAAERVRSILASEGQSSGLPS